MGLGDAQQEKSDRDPPHVYSRAFSTTPAFRGEGGFHTKGKLLAGVFAKILAPNGHSGTMNLEALLFLNLWRGFENAQRFLLIHVGRPDTKY